MSKTIPLGEVVHVAAGQPAPKRTEISADGHPFIRAGSLESLLQDLTEDDCEKVNSTVARKRRLKLFPKDTIVFPKSGMSAKIGRVYRLRKPSYVVSHLATLIPTEKYDSSFLLHWLRAHPPSRLINDAAYPSIRVSAIADLAVPDLAIGEQRRIAAILDKADAIRRKRDQFHSLSMDFLYSAYHHVVGSLNPKYSNWKPHSIEQLASDRKGSIRSGPFGSALRHSEFVDEGVAVLGIDNAVTNMFGWGERRYITDEKFEQLRRYRVFPDDVIVTIMGTVGRSAVVPHDIPKAITSKHLATITCDKAKILPEVLACSLHADSMIKHQIRAQNKGAIMDGLNLRIVRQLVLCRPPMREQKRFVRIFEKIKRVLSKIDSSSGNGSDLLAALSQRAFRGEL